MILDLQKNWKDGTEFSYTPQPTLSNFLSLMDPSPQCSDILQCLPSQNENIFSLQTPFRLLFYLTLPLHSKTIQLFISINGLLYFTLIIFITHFCPYDSTNLSLSKSQNPLCCLVQWSLLSPSYPTSCQHSINLSLLGNLPSLGFCDTTLSHFTGCPTMSFPRHLFSACPLNAGMPEGWSKAFCIQCPGDLIHFHLIHLIGLSTLYPMIPTLVLPVHRSNNRRKPFRYWYFQSSSLP